MAGTTQGMEGKRFQTTAVLDRERYRGLLEQEILTFATEDGVLTEGCLYWKKGALRPKTCVILMHPASVQLQAMQMRPFAMNGFAALKLNTRYAGDDTTLVFENTLLDLAAGVRTLRQEGFEHVVFYAQSGGAPLMSYYQAQAEHPSITMTPAGDPPDLTKADLPRAEAMIFGNIHRARSYTHTLALDPSVVDETDPLSVDPDIDMFNPKNGPPYSKDWLARYREAQIARSERITAWVLAKLDEFKRRGHPVANDLIFSVYRTVADPAYLDLGIEPNDRPAGTIWGDPYRLNWLPALAHMGRVTTLRSWLSQWGYRTSFADLYRHLPQISVPMLFVQGTADPWERVAKEAFPLATAKDKTYVSIKHGTHHYVNQPEVFDQAMTTMTNWLKERGF